jgi:hypothetical protein
VHRHRDRRVGSGGRQRKGGGDGHKVGMGNVHPAAPTSVHNDIRMIEPRSIRAARREDYSKRHGYSIG